MILNALSAASFFYLAFVLLLKSKATNTLANRWLTFFLISVGFLQLDDAWLLSGTYEAYPHLFNLLDPFLFCVAPGFYWAVYHFVQPGRRFVRRSLWHMSLSFLILLLSIPGFLASKATKLEWIKSFKEDAGTMGIEVKIVFCLLFGQCLVYVLLSFFKMRRHQKNLQMVSSNNADTDLDWLRYFLISICLLLVLWAIEVIFYPNFLGGEMSLGYLIGAYLLGYYATRQKEIYPFPPQELQAIAAIIQDNPPGLKAEAEVDEVQKLRLIKLMTAQKPYLDPELSLPKLAQLMHCSTHELSHLINQGFERNFYQFINTYRVEESKRLLQDQKLDHLNILAIGFEAGFNSKTTFNTTFKQMMGISPLEFRKRKLMA